MFASTAVISARARRAAAGSGGSTAAQAAGIG
jgi:hypothetical protein